MELRAPGRPETLDRKIDMSVAPFLPKPEMKSVRLPSKDSGCELSVGWTGSSQTAL